MKLQGKVALITGASRGIGSEIAKEFSREGALVVINYVKNDSAAEKTLEEIKSMGGYAIAIKGDVSKYDFSKSLIEKVVEKFGKIDIVINNAGISKVGLLIDMEENDWNELININLKSVFNVCRHAVNKMIYCKKGSIINISSMWGSIGGSCEVIYSASKGGVNAFTKALGKELAPNGIRVNAISPGVIDTEMNSWMNDDEKKELIDEIPIMRFGKAEEVAKLAVFLANDDSSYITAQVINIDGGI